MRVTFGRKETLPLETYRDLVALLHANLSTLIISCFLQTALCAALACRLADVISMELAFVTAATAIARLAVVLSSRAHLPNLADRPILLSWEERHAMAYWAGAAAVGAIGARVALRGDDTAIFMFAVVVANFAMELVARASGRPWICRCALAASSAPAISILLATLDTERLFEAGTLFATSAAALEVLRFNYRALTVQMKATRSFANLANADPLTGLSNRLALCGFLDRSLATRASDELIAVHCLDLDRFKEANDLFGHAVGDELLKAFASRLRKSLTPDDLVARLGGDEFVIVQCGIHREDQARQLAEFVIRHGAAPFEIGELKISVGVSVGIAVAPGQGETTQRLLARADAALYDIKRSGRNGFAFAGLERSRQGFEAPLPTAA